MIKAGERIPSVPIKLVDAGGMSDATSDVVLGEGLVVFFALPGAFTPTCHASHLPGFVSNYDKFREAGVSRIVCGTVNDGFVTKAWGEQTGALGKVDFIADGNADLARALGLDKDLSAGQMGVRFMRSALLIRDGVVEAVYVEDKPGVSVSGAPALLMALEARK